MLSSCSLNKRSFSAFCFARERVFEHLLNAQKVKIKKKAPIIKTSILAEVLLGSLAILRFFLVNRLVVRGRVRRKRSIRRLFGGV